MSPESSITFFIAIFIFAITPGPGVFAVLSRALIDGPKSCVMLILGIISSDVAYLISACFGLATIAENWSGVFIVIRYLGAGYLFYIGYKIITASPQIKIDLQQEALKTKTMVSGFIQGFLISVSNPKVILFYISFLPTFIDLNSLNSQNIVWVAILSSIALFFGLMMIAFTASRMSMALKTPIAHQRLNYSAGFLMISAGVYLVLR